MGNAAKCVRRDKSRASTAARADLMYRIPQRLPIPLVHRILEVLQVLLAQSAGVVGIAGRPQPKELRHPGDDLLRAHLRTHAEVARSFLEGRMHGAASDQFRGEGGGVDAVTAADRIAAQVQVQWRTRNGLGDVHQGGRIGCGNDGLQRADHAAVALRGRNVGSPGQRDGLRCRRWRRQPAHVRAMGIAARQGGAGGGQQPPADQGMHGDRQRPGDDVRGGGGE